MRRVLVVAVTALLVSCGDDPNTLGGGRRGMSTTGSSGEDGTGGDGSSGSTSGTSSSSGSSGSGSAAEICVETINELRATLGLPPYERWTDGESCADGQAKSDGETNRPHGSFPRCGESAQNECPGWQGPPEQMIPKCLRAMWSEGPGGGHFEQMRSSRWKMVSCGFYTTPRGAVWSVQNFK